MEQAEHSWMQATELLKTAWSARADSTAILEQAYMTATCYPNKWLDEQSSLLSKPLNRIPTCPGDKHLPARLSFGDFSPVCFSQILCTPTVSRPWSSSTRTGRIANAPLCTTAASTMPFSTDLLTSLPAEPYPVRTGHPKADPTQDTSISHFAPTSQLFRSHSSPSPTKRMTSSSFHRPQLLPHICCSLKDAKQAEYVQASSQRHCSKVSVFIKLLLPHMHI